MLMPGLIDAHTHAGLLYGSPDWVPSTTGQSSARSNCHLPWSIAGKSSWRAGWPGCDRGYACCAAVLGDAGDLRVGASRQPREIVMSHSGPVAQLRGGITSALRRAIVVITQTISAQRGRFCRAMSPAAAAGSRNTQALTPRMPYRLTTVAIRLGSAVCSDGRLPMAELICSRPDNATTAALRATDIRATDPAQAGAPQLRICAAQP
jgi:hypothetical protein